MNLGSNFYDANTSIAIVTWNRASQLQRAINSCRDNSSIKEIIVVDNNSSDCTEQVVSELSSKINIDLHYIKLPSNVGCPIARNIAMANCSGDYIYALDDDGWLSESTLSYAITHMSDQNVSIVCSKILDPQTNDVIGTTGVTRQIGKFSAGASLYRRSDLLKYGFFPNYFRQMEETYMSLVLLSNDKKIIFEPESIMYHEKIKTSKQNIQEIKYNFLHDLNNIRALLGLKWFIVLYPIKAFIYGRHYLKQRLLFPFLKALLSSLSLFFRFHSVPETKSKSRIQFKHYMQQRKLK